MYPLHTSFFTIISPHGKRFKKNKPQHPSAILSDNIPQGTKDVKQNGVLGA
jgi:hypothetical protein